MNLRPRPVFGLAAKDDPVNGNPSLGQYVADMIGQCVAPGDDIRLGFWRQIESVLAHASLTSLPAVDLPGKTPSARRQAA